MALLLDEPSFPTLLWHRASAILKFFGFGLLRFCAAAVVCSPKSMWIGVFISLTSFFEFTTEISRRCTQFMLDFSATRLYDFVYTN